uniref:Uncharacterized protein n=1 Tax=Caenorhabditis japonica TaxID=281687 RepID=A0A8R1EAQ5_CAEJA
MVGVICVSASTKTYAKPRLHIYSPPCNAATKQGCSWPGFRIKTASESAASIGRGLMEVAGMRTQGTSAAGKRTRQGPGPKLQRHWHPRQVPPRTGTG